MDLAPTILNFAGIKTPENWEALALNKMLNDGVWDDADPEKPYASMSMQNLVVITYNLAPSMSS